jgi:hypothetical protein
MDTNLVEWIRKGTLAELLAELLAEGVTPDDSQDS